MGRRWQRRLRIEFGLRQFGQAEVENLYPVIIGDENIFRLDVAMHDATLVRCGQTTGNLHAIVENLALPHGALGKAGAQRRALQQF